MSRREQAVVYAGKCEAVRYDADVRMKGDVITTIDFLLSPNRGPQGKVFCLAASAERKKTETHVCALVR